MTRPQQIEAFAWLWVAAALCAYLYQFRDLIPAILAAIGMA
jgi:hypothetical protein